MMLFHRHPSWMDFWEEIVLNPADNLYYVTVICSVLLVMSMFNICLYISAVYSKMTKTAPQILEEVSDICRRIDQLDNPEFCTEDVLQQMNCLGDLLSRLPVYTSREICSHMESLCLSILSLFKKTAAMGFRV